MFSMSNMIEWLKFWEITYTDIMLFIVLLLLMLLGFYIAIKKDIILGGLQIFFTFFTPYMVLRFYNEFKPYWEIPKKRWIMTFSSNFTGDISFLGLLLLVFVPLFICVTVKSIHLICDKD